MDIEKTWQESEPGISISPKEIRESMRQRPEGVLRKLRNQLLIKLIFTVVFTIGYIVLVVLFDDLFVRLLFGVLILVHLVGIWFFTRQWLRLKRELDFAGPVIGVLEEYLVSIRRTLKVEELTGLLLYPVAGSAGFFFSLTQEMDWSRIMESRWIWITWLITIVVLTPLAHLLAKWMNRVSFGKYLSRLDGYIADLKGTNTDSLQ